MKRLGTYNGYNYYNNATWYAVRRFQASHHLKATGNVDQIRPWQKALQANRQLHGSPWRPSLGRPQGLY
ncbi:peptidoglycan-binding domain-containing protein [Lactobacillus delbrueckii subsp. bulgaricus]|nr:hypothetical protein [Lactobacillus delbrueckii subsp. bulgaricus]MBT8851337.1 hypothetical protein [Lactobacillus delbrueckii subsp. bulgaricus]